MKSFAYTGRPEKGFGWGTANTYLSQELRKLFPVEGLDIVMQPLADHDLNASSQLRGKINLGYTFFEFPLGPKAEENAAKYDIVFCGSTWCKERLAERGILNTCVLIQGVDQSIFYPRPRKPDGQFRIFSGGKFEWRKGQDLVVKAFAQFARQYPEAHLVCAWHNPWPGLAIDCAKRAGLTANGNTLVEFYTDMLVRAGIPQGRFTILPQLSHEQLAAEMAQTDCGVFPNRCEGGTNLVLMEYAAMGRTVAANIATGHWDVSSLIDVHIHGTEDAMGWWDQTPQAVEVAMNHARLQRGETVYSSAAIPTWEDAAKTVANAVEQLASAV